MTKPFSLKTNLDNSFPLIKAGMRANACVYRMAFPIWGLGMSGYTQKDLDKSLSYIYYHEHFLHLHFYTPKFTLRLRDRVEILTGGDSPRVPTSWDRACETQAPTVKVRMEEDRF